MPSHTCSTFCSGCCCEVASWLEVCLLIRCLSTCGVPGAWQGVLQGSSAELREIAAGGLGELVDVTSQEALRPFTVQITGRE